MICIQTWKGSKGWKSNWQTQTSMALILWPCTLEVGLSKAEKCSGLLPETQRKTVKVSLSFLFDVSVGHPSSCHMDMVMLPCSNEE